MSFSLKTKITRNRKAELTKQGRQAAATWNAKRAEEAAVIARKLVPVATGALKESITVELNRRTGSATLIAGSEQVDYGIHVEYGTSVQPAQPFIRPAIEKVRKQSRNRTFKMFR